MDKNVEIDRELCTGCGECVKICPVKILHIDEKTGKCAVSDDTRCGGSGCCLKKCKYGAITIKKRKSAIEK